MTACMTWSKNRLTACKNIVTKQRVETIRTDTLDLFSREKKERANFTLQLHQITKRIIQVYKQISQ